MRALSTKSLDVANRLFVLCKARTMTDEEVFDACALIVAMAGQERATLLARADELKAVGQ